jgi:hypothetical protein
VPFFDPAFLLLRQLPEYLPEILVQLPVQRPSSALRYEDDMIFALSCRVT